MWPPDQRVLNSRNYIAYHFTFIWKYVHHSCAWNILIYYQSWLIIIQMMFRYTESKIMGMQFSLGVHEKTDSIKKEPFSEVL